MKTIAKLLPVMMLLLSSFTLGAQSAQAKFIPTHEFSLGYGVFPLVPSMFGWGGGDMYPAFTGDGYIDALQTKGDRIVTGALTLNYMYNKLKWFSFGVSFSHHGNYASYYNRITEDKIYTEANQSFSLLAIARFNYLNKEKVRLYSELGLGIGLYFQKPSYSSSYAHLTGQVTLFGVSFGRDLFGFVEILGVGAKGAAIAGIGYKF